jgi:hypothetical protein
MVVVASYLACGGDSAAMIAALARALLRENADDVAGFCQCAARTREAQRVWPVRR